MIKKLLIGASALAMSSVSVFAAAPAAQSEQEITNVGTRPFADEATWRGSFGSEATAPTSIPAAPNSNSAFQGDKAAAAARVDTAAQILDGVASQVATQSTGNVGVVDQDGNNNTGTIEQNGNNGYAVVNQRNTTTAGQQRQTATVTQTDAAGGTGTQNQAYVEQLHNGNTSAGTSIATVTQTHTIGAAGLSTAANRAVLLQGQNALLKNSSRGSITQSGANNDAVLSQGADPTPGQNATGNSLGDANATIVQTGYSNVAAVQQQNRTRGGAPFNTSSTTVEQIGNEHRAYVLQTGANSTGFNSAKVLQGGGDGNFAAVDQETNAEMSNASYVTQSGGRNTAWSQQKGGRLESAITQTGDDNYAEVRQLGLDQRSVVEQKLSNANEAYVTQTSLAAGANSAVFQSGSGGNLAVVYQNVAGDLANISQNGGANIASIRQ